ncbi:MAG TPA: hypothetical protein VGN19_03730, partial [Pedococcus sp.]|nr:hypothetical protein [Pedococcus sp.]
MSEQTTDQPSTGATPAPKGTSGERASSFSLDVDRRNIPTAFREYVGRLRSGEPGTLPAVLGILVLGIMFSFVSSRFLSSNNIG